MPAIQAKLTINEPGDQYEQEADRVSEQVMRAQTPDPAHTAPPAIQRLGAGVQEALAAKHLQRLCAGCEEEQEKEMPLQRRAAPAEAFAGGGDAPRQAQAKVDAVSGGQRLTNQQRSFFEPRFGADFGQVRIHADSGADAAARAVGALAYTRGRDIVFRSDQYRPDTPAGGRLLAHELTHVVQQGGATARRQNGSANANGAGRIQRQTGPQIKPLPGEGMEAPGDCNWPHYILLKLNVEVAKNIVEQLGTCDKGDSCLVLATKIAAASGEITARFAMMEACFRGGDKGHQDQIKNKVVMLKECYKTFSDSRKNCSEPLLRKAAFAVEQMQLLITAAVATLLTVAAIIVVIVAIMGLLEVISVLAAAVAATAAVVSAAGILTMLAVILQLMPPSGGPPGGEGPVGLPTKLKT